MAIVLAGSFNPSIFQPAWFARYQILRDSEVDQADILMVNPQLAHFRTDWLELQVFRQRFMVVSRNGGYEGPLVDLVVSTFKRLEHTPVKALGMNREVKLQFDSIERWHRFGHLLAPKEIWGDLLVSPGLLGMQMQGQGVAKGDLVSVAISNTGERKADIDINDHRPSENPETAMSALEKLQNSWADSQTNGMKIVGHFLGLIASKS